MLREKIESGFFSNKYFDMFLFLFVQSWTPIFIKILSSEFDVITQNFYRFLFADVLLVSISHYMFKDDLRRALKNLKVFIFPAMLTSVAQNTMVYAIGLTTAVLASLLTKLSVIFTVLLSFLFFKEERKIIRSIYFLIGLVLTIGGFVGVILGRGSSVGLGGDDFNVAIVVFVVTALLFGLYRVSVKKLVTDYHPFVAFTVICIMMTIMFFPFVLVYGNLRIIFEVGLFENLVLFFSGFFSVSIANGFYYKAVKDFGVAIPNTLLLLLPFSTGVISWFVLGELLSSMQIVAGIVLLAGCFFIFKGKRANAKDL